MQKFIRVPLIIIGMTIAFGFFIFGYFFGHNYRQDSFFVVMEKASPAVDMSLYQDTGIDANEKININSANSDQLCQLKGIGPVLAERIIEYRTKHGGFKYKFEIMNVTGIGKSLYKDIKEDIVV